MREADFATKADYLRAHRAAFVLALELGVTPIEAEREIKRREIQHCRAKLRARRDAPLVPGMPELRAGHDPDEPRQPHWLRD